MENVQKIFCRQSEISVLEVLFILSHPTILLTVVQQHPFKPCKSASVSPSALLLTGGIKSRTAGVVQIPPLSLCPPLHHKHMGTLLCQCASQNTWLCLVTHGGQNTHTSTQDRHTFAHTKTHRANLAWRAYPWLSPDIPPTVSHTSNCG